MENENLLGLMYGISQAGSLAGRGLQPGEVSEEIVDLVDEITGEGK